MKHLDQIGETYWQHFCFAGRVGLVMFLCGLCAMAHAIYPKVFPHTASKCIDQLHKLLNERNSTDEKE